MDTSQLQGLDAPKFGKSPDDIFADMQKRAEIQAAARDALKKKSSLVTSDASPDHMIVDDDCATSSKGKVSICRVMKRQNRHSPQAYEAIT